MDKELVAEWFRFAEIDIDTALLLKDMRPQHYEVICFHCQQAAEKYLKGFLISKDQMPPKTHDLDHLCHLCAEHNNNFLDLLTQCIYLTRFAVQPRYPEEIHVTSIDVDKAVKYALNIKDFPVIAQLMESVNAV